MKTLVTVLLALSGFAAAADVPASIAHVNVVSKKAGWMGSVLLLDTPDDQGNLQVTFVQMQNDGTNKVITNKNLLGKQEDPALADIAKTYEANVTMQDSTGSILLSAYRDFGTSMWIQDITVALRNGEFVIAGLHYVYDYREQHGDCSLDFLSGKAVVNGKAVKVAPTTLKFATADEAAVVGACSKLLGL